MSTTNILQAKVKQSQIPKVYRGKAAFYDIWGKMTESKAQDRCLELANIRDGETILEVAVGTGLTFTKILRQNPSGLNEGLDLTDAMLAKAEEKAAQTGNDNYRLRLGDAYNLPFSDHSFDLLVNNYMFDLLPLDDFGHILNEFRRVIRPDGRLILVNMAQGAHWYNHIWDAIYKVSPPWMGGCRGVSLLEPVREAGFNNAKREFVSQLTFPSEVISATVKSL